MKINELQLYIDDQDEHRWRLIAAEQPDDDIIADSGQGYVDKDDAYASALRVMTAGVSSNLNSDEQVFRVVRIGDDDTRTVLLDPSESLS